MARACPEVRLMAPIQPGHVRVVALEEEIVGVPIGVRVHQDRATRPTVTPGASDFLVVRFQAAR